MSLTNIAETWRKNLLVQQIMDYKEVLWLNSDYFINDEATMNLSLSEKDILEAEQRLKRFAPYIAKVFPETEEKDGMIESPLTNIVSMKAELESRYNVSIHGQMFLKEDNKLPISGSVKARGGIYEVLKLAEDLAMKNNMIHHDDDYTRFSHFQFKSFFSNYSIVCGSTGNLGLSIGIMGAVLGFNVIIHMSKDAKQWKKDLLRSKGAKVVEHSDDYSKAVEVGRKQALQDEKSYFVDDENSRNLFLGYAVAALRLKEQLKEKNITVNEENPLFVYLPCGVGGAPGGITFGLKTVFGQGVHCFFVEPTHSPCMLLGLMTKQHSGICVQDFGLDNQTEADGLAVGRPSRFIGEFLEHLICGVYTISDNELFSLLHLLKDKEAIKVEPSAAAGMAGPVVLHRNKGNHLVTGQLEKATHIAWSTGGSMVPEDIWDSYYEKGKIITHK
jgi:D-serine dehydratase